MAEFLNPNEQYSRKGNMIYNAAMEKVATLKQWFPDIPKLTVTGIEYLNKYQSLYPDLVEITTYEPFEQLTLF
ncbi:hypothetical protein [Flavobacterium limnosediminis]|nr:hypothetical protein [Flavobacterium limnosediminis]